MSSALFDVDISTSSFRQQEYNGSCLVLEDKGLTTSVSYGDRKQAEYWVKVMTSGALVAVATVLGIPGNGLSAAVFYRQGLRERINLCLFALAIVNLIVLVPLLMGDVEYLYRYTVRPTWVVSPHTYCLAGAVWASDFLSAVIASERCFCVVSPFHAKRLLKTSTMAAIIVVCCVLLTAGMCAIAGPKHRSVCVFHPTTNIIEEAEYVTESLKNAVLCSNSYYMQNKVIIDILDIFVYATALPGTFLVVIIVSTCITAVKVRTALVWRLTTASKTTSSASVTTSTRDEVERKVRSKEVNLTVMLMATSVLSTVCIMTTFIVQMCIYTVPGFNYGGPYFTLISSLWRIIYFLWALNASMNFVVYYKMGSKFRDTVRHMIGR